MKIIRRGGLVLVVFAALWWLAACGGSSGGGGSSTATNDTTKTVPSDVVLSSPTASASASASISKAFSKDAPPPVGDKPGDPQGEDFRAKREAMQNLLSASGECGFTMSMPTIANVSCYGPVINYANHPDAMGGGPAGGQLPVGDTGFWDTMEGSEACSAAKMNELVDKVASRVDNIVKIFGTMACAGKKAGTDLPAVGSRVDMKETMSANMAVSGLTVASASLERQSDDASGNEVYQSRVETEMAFSGETNSNTLILKHIPTADDNSTYKGKLSFVQHVDWSAGNCQGVQGASPGGTIAGTILYEKASASLVTHEVNYAEFCGEATNPLDANNNIDPADKVSPQNPDGWANNWHYGVFRLNPTNGTGDVAFAWQAGQADGRTRVLNCSTAEAADASASGTCYYGYGPDIAAATGKGSIDGFVFNWAGPGGAIGAPNNDRSAANLLAIGRGVSKAQRQVLARAAGAADFTPTGSNILYAPANSGGRTAESTFTYQAVSQEGGAALVLDNDRPAAGTAVADELIALADVAFTVPTPPGDI